MYCIKCGAKNSDEFNYCSNCGAKLFKEIEVSDFDLPVEKNWDDIVYSQDEHVPFKNQAQDVYTNYGGENYNPQMITDEDLKYSKMSIAGFILSCCSFLTFELGWICMILGYIFSIIGLVSKKYKSGKSFAIAGIVISSSYLIIFTVVFMTFGPLLGIILPNYYY